MFTVTNDLQGNQITSVRSLLEPGSDFFVRNNKSISILQKIALKETAGKAVGIGLPHAKRFERQVSGQKPFGLRTFFRGEKQKKRPDDVLVLQNGGRAWVQRKKITEGIEMIDKWKVFTSKSSRETRLQSYVRVTSECSSAAILPLLSMTSSSPGSSGTERFVRPSRRLNER